MAQMTDMPSTPIATDLQNQVPDHASNGELEVQSASEEVEIDKPASFLDLSAELRNIIYSLVLIDEEPIRMTEIRVSLGSFIGIVEIPRMATPSSYGPETQIPVRQHPAFNNTAILRANRQVHDEATPMLYGGNIFDLVGLYVDTTKRFCKQIGPSIMFLRQIIAPYVRKSSSQSVLSALKKATQLDKIIISRSMRKGFDPATLAKAFGPLSRALHKARKVDQPNVVNIIECALREDPHSTPGDAADAEKYTTELKNLLEKELKKATESAVVPKKRRRLGGDSMIDS